ncbi:MAG TPA: DsrE family protein [Casimicrobiaceae bacterium]|nr:DsrE family protein [Casimicrobiaceae bacterium]
MKLFLIGDAAACAKDGQKVPEGFYNLALMLGRVARSGGAIGVCGTCMDARGIGEGELFPRGPQEHARGTHVMDAMGGQGDRVLTAGDPPRWTTS